MRHKRVFTEDDERCIVESYLKLKNLAVLRKKFHTTVKEIKNILAKHEIYSGVRTVKLNESYFQEINSPEKAYWLGFIVADGCLHKEKTKLSFNVKDSDILYKFRQAIDSEHHIKYSEYFDKRTTKKYSRYSLQVTSTKFCNYLRSIGIDENKSKNFLFPNIPTLYYNHFIRGMFDGDGSICIRKSKKYFSKSYQVNLISSLECISHIKSYLCSIGINSQKISEKPQQGIYYLVFGKDSKKFLHWLYIDSTESIRLDRKYKLYLSIQDPK